MVPSGWISLVKIVGPEQCSQRVSLSGMSFAPSESRQ
jgi:hypothetical protein